MTARHEFRVAVGSKSGRRSTVWKFFVDKDDIYIVSGMFEGDCKISLHPSGDCQFSGTSHWVKKVPGRRNAERHIVKWHKDRPTGTDAAQVLQIRIPESELRAFSSTAEDLSQVYWLPAPAPNNYVAFQCYITCPKDSDPVIGSSLPCDVLFYSELADKRWLVVLNFQAASNEKVLNDARRQLDAEASKRGMRILPTYRATAHMFLEGEPPIFIEFCLTAETSNSNSAATARA